MNTNPAMIADSRWIYQLVLPVLLLIIAFVEMALAYFPVFHGAAPKLLIAMLYIVIVRGGEPVSLVSLVIIGTIYDSLQGNPLGYTPAALVIVSLAARIRAPRIHDTPFVYIWFEFAAIMVLVSSYTIIAALSYHQTIPAPGPLVFQFGVTILFFPLVRWCHRRIEQLLDLVQQTR